MERRIWKGLAREKSDWHQPMICRLGKDDTLCRILRMILVVYSVSNVIKVLHQNAFLYLFNKIWEILSKH